MNEVTATIGGATGILPVQKWVLARHSSTGTRTIVAISVADATTIDLLE
jgi:hypothetical protein